MKTKLVVQMDFWQESQKIEKETYSFNEMISVTSCPAVGSKQVAHG